MGGWGCTVYGTKEGEREEGYFLAFSAKSPSVLSTSERDSSRGRRRRRRKKREAFGRPPSFQKRPWKIVALRGGIRKGKKSEGFKFIFDEE